MKVTISSPSPDTEELIVSGIPPGAGQNIAALVADMEAVAVSKGMDFGADFKCVADLEKLFKK